MQKLKQMVVMRENHERDEGTMGFHDYVTVKEDFNKFVDRVTEACETVNGKFLGVLILTKIPPLFCIDGLTDCIKFF